MSLRILSPLLVVFCGLVACKKDGDAGSMRTHTDTVNMVQGKWRIVKDSLYTANNFYFMEGGTPHVPTPGVYTGAAADYFQFDANGAVTVYENQNSAASTWQVLADNTLSIAGLAVYPPAQILTLNTNKFTVFWTSASPNGGQYARTLYLEK